MSDIPKTLTDHYRVRSYEVGPDERASLAAIANYLQETAGHHASALNLGPSHLVPKGIFWVLSRLRLRMNHFPAAQESLEVLTWPSARDRHVASRDFRIMDAEGNLIGEATTAWLVFDLKTRKVIDIPVWIGRDLPQAPPRNLDFETRLIPRLREAGYEKTIPIRRADLDMLGHANNVRYLEWVLEAPPDEWWNDHVPVEADIQFRIEAHAGDLVLTRCAEDGEMGFLHSLVRREDGAEVVRAKTRWTKR
ncbi:MAG: acyl-ACP thioesterase domain-containing protein [bacterium]